MKKQLVVISTALLLVAGCGTAQTPKSAPIVTQTVTATATQTETVTFTACVDAVTAADAAIILSGEGFRIASKGVTSADELIAFQPKLKAALETYKTARAACLAEQARK